MKVFILILTSFFSLSCFGVELIIGGEIYHIDEYQIKDNGQTIIIPHTVYFNESAFKEAQDDCNPGGNEYAGSDSKENENKEYQLGAGATNSGVSQLERSPSANEEKEKEAPKAKKHPMQQLMDDLDGEYQKLYDSLQPKKGTYKRNMR